MSEQKIVGYLQDGTTVIDRQKTHIHAEVPGIDVLISKTLSHVVPGPELFTVFSYDFGEIIGTSICVETGSSDEIVFAQRVGRQGFSRFVKGRAEEDRSVCTVVLKKDAYSANTQYILITAYVGEAAPPEPWDKHATSTSLPFWNTHALVWGSVPIVNETVTLMCPW